MAASNARSIAVLLFIAAFANGLLSCAQGPVAAQTLAQVTPPTAAMLEQMTHSAGVVFAGEVISVERPAGYTGSARDAVEGFVVIRFRVDEAVRGCAAGSIYTLREWAGLWVGAEHYRAGQRLLVFLHAPDGDGLTSSLHGAAGVIPLRGGGTAPGPYDASAVAGDWVVDLRWVEAQAMRVPVGEAGHTDLRPPEQQPKTRPEFYSETGPELRPVNNGAVHWVALPYSTDRSMPLLAQVLSLCRAWASSAPGIDTARNETAAGRTSANGTP